MKILHITDSHATMKSPESRIDVYYIAFLRKLYELKYVIKKEKINLIIHTGDLFHSSKVSDKFAGQIAEIIKDFGIPVYVVPGNHDILGYNIDTIEQTKLGLLYKTGVIKELDRDHPIQLTSRKEGLSINISGQEYYADIDTGNMEDFEMRSNNQADVNILCIHGYLCDKPQNPNIAHTLCDDVISDADIILSGHFHESFEYHRQNLSVYNPGSMMRVERNAYNKNHIPQYGILEIKKDSNGLIKTDYKMNPFKIAQPSTDVFDYNAAMQQKQTMVSIDNFKNSIANTNLNSNMNLSIVKIIEDVANKLSYDQDIIDKTVDYYNNTVNDIEENSLMDDGYVTDVSSKYIVSVEIHNFQSHKDTKIEFENGLNVIIGDSNSGKTAILRAIQWCIDNYPLGSDFITTGEDDCHVTINFSDGTSITRERTRDKSGSYVVTGKTAQPDGSYKFWTQTYKGFGSKPLIEVLNVHQMPKINLTKDISTHLNVMSQLDPAFLVTDSPLNKASIIGRLTGTQNIDATVKFVNKESLGCSKEVTRLTKERDDLYPKYEEQKERFSNLEIRTNLIRVINNYWCSAQSNFFNKLDSVFDLSSVLDIKIENFKAIQEAAKKIDSEIDYCAKYRTVLYCLVDEIKLLQKYNHYNSLLEQKIRVNQNIQILSFADRLLKVVNTIRDRISIIAKINESYAKYQFFIDQQEKLNVKANIVNEFCSKLSDIIAYAGIKRNTLKCVMPYYNKYKSCLNFNPVDLTDQIQEVQDQINDLQAQKENKILEFGICPCCGQKLTAKKHAKSVDEFMKGR